MKRCLWCDAPIDRWDFCSRQCGDEWRNARVELDRGLTREEYETRKAARAAVRRAVDRGELEKGHCEKRIWINDEGQEVVDLSGCAGPIDGHHDDYSQPLKVRWLCRRHHQGEHREMRALSLRKSDPQPPASTIEKESE